MSDTIDNETTHAKRADLRIKFAAKNELRRQFYEGGNRAHQRSRELRRRVGGAFGQEKHAGDLYIGTSGGNRLPSTSEESE